jgi:hypothetical protein
MVMERVTKRLPCGKSVTFAGDLKMKEFRKWVRAEQAGDFDTVFACLARIVDGWDWDLDPKDPSSYDELGIHEYQQLSQAAAEWLTSAIQAKN